MVEECQGRYLLVRFTFNLFFQNRKQFEQIMNKDIKPI